MKKLTTLFVLVFLAISLFAEPKVPKYFYDDSDTKEDEFIYVSNDLMYCYTVQAIYSPSKPRFKYILKIEKASLLYDSTMSLHVFFETEKQLDNFTKDFHLSDIENEFIRIRKLCILDDEKPNPTRKDFDKEYFDYQNRPKNITYQLDGTKIK